MKHNFFSPSRVILSLLFILSILYPVDAKSKSVKIATELNANTVVYTFDQGNQPKSIQASGLVVFPQNRGYVRILLVDHYGLEYLIYESIPLTATNGSESFVSKSEEVRDLSGINSSKIIVEINNAILKSLDLGISDQVKVESRAVLDNIRQNRIALINQNLATNNALWEAGDTPISSMSYEDKKNLFGGVLPDLQGFDYYVGGVFELGSESKSNVDIEEDHYVKTFDWRTRHGANNPSSPYYNGSNGWMTPPKNQGVCGACWAFAGIGALEANANLFFNQFLNLDLSEQEIVSCAKVNGCVGGQPSDVLRYIKNNGVIDEMTFSYQEENGVCASKPLVSNEHITIADYVVHPRGDFSTLKRVIINSPSQIGVNSWAHEMTALGYKTLSVGDWVYTTKLNNKIQIGVDDPRIGKTAFLFKNSWGDKWGDNGYCYIITDLSNLTISSITLPIVSRNHRVDNIPCFDKDGDGYYYWGSGEKPSTCPDCPDEPDADDSDPTIGPMNEFGHTEEVLLGNAEVCPYSETSYTYYLPYKVLKDTVLSVSLKYRFFGEIQDKEVMIKKGTSYGIFKVLWKSSTVRWVDYINIGSISYKVTLVKREQTLPKIDFDRSLTKLENPIGYTVADDLESYLLPMGDDRTLRIEASDLLGLTTQFQWETVKGVYPKVNITGGKFFYLNSEQSSMDDIVIKVTPVGRKCSETKTIVLKRLNLNLVRLASGAACDTISYGLDMIEGLSDNSQLSWSAGNNLRLIEDNYYRALFKVEGSGFGEVKLIVRPYLYIQLPDGSPAFSDEAFYLENNKIWVGAPLTAKYTEIDNVNITRMPDNNKGQMVFRLSHGDINHAYYPSWINHTPDYCSLKSSVYYAKDIVVLDPSKTLKIESKASNQCGAGSAIYEFNPSSYMQERKLSALEMDMDSNVSFENQMIAVYTLNGVLLKSFRVSGDLESNDLGLPKGVYIVKVQTATAQKVGKVIVK